MKCEVRLCMFERPCDVIMQCSVSWSHLCYSQCYGLHFDQLLPAENSVPDNAMHKHTILNLKAHHHPVVSGE